MEEQQRLAEKFIIDAEAKRQRALTCSTHMH